MTEMKIRFMIEVWCVFRIRGATQSRTRNSPITSFWNPDWKTWASPS